MAVFSPSVLHAQGKQPRSIPISTETRMSVARSFRQQSPYVKGMCTVIATAWIYPAADVEIALATTTTPYTRVGNIITGQDISGCIALAEAIFQQTAVTQPNGNVGYALGEVTFLTDRGKDLFIKLPSGETVIQYRLLKQATPQQNPPIPSPAVDTPNETIGYGIIFNALGTDAGTPGYLYNIDPVRFARLG